MQLFKKTYFGPDASEGHDFGVRSAQLVDAIDEDPRVQLELALWDRKEHLRKFRFEDRHLFRARSGSDDDSDE